MTSGGIVEGLHQVALSTADLEKSTAFYRDKLGLTMIARFDPPGLAFFRIGETRLSVQESAESSASRSVLYFKVDDIISATQRLKDKGIKFEQDPELVFKDDAGQFGDAGAEEWMSFFRDPDGNLLSLASRRKSS